MNPAREFSIATMRATRVLPKDDFLARNHVAAPMPTVAGAIPEHARVPFPAVLLGFAGSLAADLLVLFTIGDFPGDMPCSAYYDPQSPWYNVFYGAYGVRSNEKDGSYWGYDANGSPDFDEMLKIPEFDYNFLTAGQLGCPPAKRCFRVKSKVTRKVDCWDTAEVTAVVPSGLHRLEDAVNPNVTYYTIFGAPDPKLIGDRESYEPVDMRGQMFFRPVQAREERITLVWGALCPDPGGNALLKTILDALRPGFPCP